MTNENFFALACAAVDFAGAVKIGSLDENGGGIRQVSDDLAAAAVSFAAASSPRPEDQGDDFSDCAFG
jgi:hypothetical protein